MEGRACACKGIRSCLVCEGADKVDKESKDATAVFYQCYRCGCILKEEDLEPDLEARPLLVCSAGSCGPREKIIRAKKEGFVLDNLSSTVFEGVTIIKEFVSREEEREIVSQIDTKQWAESQSGRRKQVSEAHHSFHACFDNIIYTCGVI